MVDFPELQNRIKSLLEADRLIRVVEAKGDSLEDAVAEAAVLLQLPVRRVEYEVTKRGAAGFLGQGVKQWTINAYAQAVETNGVKDKAEDDVELEEKPAFEEVSIDGEVFVRFNNGEVLLKVTPHTGKGKPVTEKEACAALGRRRVQGYSDALVGQIVKEASGKYVRVAEFHHNMANDGIVRIEISPNEMSAYVLVTPPGMGGNDVSHEGLKNLLRSNGVIFGIKESFLEHFADCPTYGTRVCAAEGMPVANGADAHMEYFFEVNPAAARLRETAKGAVNFKELNIIQNVMVGDKLACKIPPGKGEQGQTVTGKVLPAVNGKDIPLPIGQNVSVGKDGLTIFANENGQVMLNGNIEVEKVLTVEGSVGVKTGNVIFLGSVFVKGNVEEGYSIKATGNIEVTGSVDKADLDSEGDVIIRQGIAGKPGVLVRAGRTIIAKFIENATVKCGGMIVVSDGILNSEVSARQRVICQGKRAAIIGGKISAGEEIYSKVLGSASGSTETVCEVGYDPEMKEKLTKVTESQAKLKDELDDLQRNVSTLTAMKERQKELSEDKEQYLAELQKKQRDLDIKRSNLDHEMQGLEEYLSRLQLNGKVSVSAKCYPGTVIYVRDLRAVIRTEYKSVTFTALGGMIDIGKFTESNENPLNQKA
jgi:uncharacterized protein (DUF342 family)